MSEPIIRNSAYLEKPLEKPTNANSVQIGGDHYSKLKFSPWDVYRDWMTPEQFSGFMRGSVLKYMIRYRDKGGVEDLKKARHYLDKLIEVEEEFNTGKK